MANTVVLLGGTTLSVALIVDNVANGAARPLFGWISDNIGREYTMAIAFALGGVSYWLLGSLGTAPWAFVVFACEAGFTLLAVPVLAGAVLVDSSVGACSSDCLNVW